MDGGQGTGFDKGPDPVVGSAARDARPIPLNAGSIRAGWKRGAQGLISRSPSRPHAAGASSRDRDRGRPDAHSMTPAREKSRAVTFGWRRCGVTGG